MKTRQFRDLHSVTRRLVNLRPLIRQPVCLPAANMSTPPRVCHGEREVKAAPDALVGGVPDPLTLPRDPAGEFQLAAGSCASFPQRRNTPRKRSRRSLALGVFITNVWS